MAVTVTGGAESDAVVWDGKRHSYRPDPDWLSRVDPSVELHADVASDLDPVTFEVIRNRLWTSNLAHGETLQRISGSPAFQAMDFNMCILTEEAELVVNGPFMLYLASGALLAVPYIMERYGGSPGIEDGDMYLVSDPWIGACHQMDVLFACPVFVDGRLFAWVCNAGHQYDLGGIVPGGWPQNAVDIYYDPVLFSPIKVVERDVVREDLAMMFQRQSRVPDLVALDFRSQIAGCRFARGEVVAMCEEFGADVVKAAMHGILDNAQRSLQEKLGRVPDATYSEVRYVTERMPGDRGSYPIQVNVAKTADRLVVDNVGTVEQMDGPMGFVYAVLSGSVLGATALTWLWEHTFSLGGAARQIAVDPVPGLLTCVDYPAAVSGGIFNSATLLSGVMDIYTRMMTCDPDLRQDAVSAADSCELLVLTGVNHRGEYVGQAIFEGQAGGPPGSIDADGVDTGAAAMTPLMPLLDVETYEQFFPILYLYRRELTDGGGAGRTRGGTGTAVAFTPYRAEHLEIVTTNGGPSTTTHWGVGLFGGSASPKAQMIVAKDTNLAAVFADQRVPTGLDDIEAQTTTTLRGKSNGTTLAAGDVVACTFSGGGGFGDPLERDAELVGRDVTVGYVSAQAADELYGVVIAADGAVDQAATTARRAEILDGRRTWTPARDFAAMHGPVEADPVTAASGEDARAVHPYLAACDRDGQRVLACARCDHAISDYRSPNFKLGLLIEELPATAIPGAGDPSLMTDTEFVLRNYCCPGCFGLLESEIVVAGNPISAVMQLL